METPEPEAPTTANTSPNSSAQLAEDWLKSESTKLTLSLLDDRRKARRSALHLLWLAAAYIGIAAVSHVQNAMTTASQLDRAAKQLEEQNKTLTSAKSNAQAAFKTYLGAVYDSESLAGQVTVAGKDVGTSKEVAAQVKGQTDNAQHKHHAALAARNAAEGDPLPSAPSAAQQNRRDLPNMLASAKQEHTRTENEWQTKQRELNAAQSSYAAANTQHDKLKREHDSIQLTLPVLNLEVAPVYFFALAPLFLLVLYWNVVAKDKTIARSLQHVTEQLDTELIDEQAIAQVIPELESARSSVLGRGQGLLPDLVAIVIVGMLAYLGPTLLHLVAIALLLVTVGFRAKSLASSRAVKMTGA